MDADTRKTLRSNEISEAEIEKARLDFQRFMESVGGWRDFLDDPKHHDITYWMLFSVLFASPKITRSKLAEKIKKYAGVSKSTAERAIEKASKGGLIKAEHVANKRCYKLTDDMFDRCLSYHRRYLAEQKT